MLWLAGGGSSDNEKSRKDSRRRIKNETAVRRTQTHTRLRLKEEGNVEFYSKNSPMKPQFVSIYISVVCERTMHFRTKRVGRTFEGHFCGAHVRGVVYEAWGVERMDTFIRCSS